MEVINTIGSRKTAVARIYLKEGQGTITVNDRDYKEYFPTSILQFKVTEPFEVTEHAGQIRSQSKPRRRRSYAARQKRLHSPSPARLCKINEEYRPPLKAKGLLMRDPRMVERKKFGQKKARKRFQFSKR